MALIYETEHFIVESHKHPEVDRREGGHIKISPKTSVPDRTHLTANEAIELMRLTIVTGKAMVEGMKESGVVIGRINYQDNGNWKPYLHIHLYGRAVNATMQKYGDPIIPGHKDTYQPLSDADINNIRAMIERYFDQEEFSDNTWGLK